MKPKKTYLCEVCMERKPFDDLCFVPANLLSGYEDLGVELIDCCESCCRDDGLDPNEYRDMREY